MSKLLLAIICLSIGTFLGFVFAAMCAAGAQNDDREDWKK